MNDEWQATAKNCVGPELCTVPHAVMPAVS